MFGFLLMVRVVGIGVALGFYVDSILVIAVCAPVAMLAVLISTTPMGFFTPYFYSFATGQTLLERIDTYSMQNSFSQRQGELR